MRLGTRLLKLGCVALGVLALVPAPARAQSAIAGVVKDATGAVLPGATVEASSPALIEKTRAVVTDEAGQYKIVDLRPGTYAVTFTLEGFSSFKREGLELPSNFTATVNAELKVGSISESVTVSGQSPVVDLQNAAQQQILPRAVIDAVPTGKSVWAIGGLVPGVTLSGVDVGGSRGMQQLTMAVHGSDGRDTTVQVDGMMVNSFQDNVQTYFNDQMFEEMNYQTGAITAETSGAGVRLNMIPKDGGNQIKGTVYSAVQPSGFVGNNATTDLLARGLVAPGKNKINRDLSGSFGGPIMKDRLWFFASARRWGVDQYVNNSFYNLDPTHRTWQLDPNRQVVDNNLIKSAVVRLTYRTGPHKFAAYEDRIIKDRGHECGSNVLEENCGIRIPRIYYTAQVKYTGTLTSRLLIEGGLSINNESFSTGDPQPSVRPGDIARRELVGGPATSAPAGGLWSAPTTRNNRFPEIAKQVSGSMTYVTGSHAYKAGVQVSRGIEVINQTVGLPGVNDLVQEYRNGAPASVVVYNTPVINDVRSQYDLGIFAQDSWTLKRLTVNPGIRLEFFNSYYSAQTAPAGRFIGPRNFAEEPESEQPHWKDWAPRLGAVYDLFGDNKTAVKASWGKYVQVYHAAFSSSYNPMTQSTDQRTWIDLNGDDIAQGDLTCDTNRTWNTPGCEIGPTNNTLFGKSAVRAPAPGIKRPYNTETAFSVQRQVVPGVSVTLGYTRRDYKRMIYTQNLATQPIGSPVTTGYAALQIPNPINPSETLTVYNLDPALRGLVNDYDQNSSNNKRWFNAWDLGFQSRLFGGTVFGGGSWGQQITVTCDVREPNYISTTAAPGLTVLPTGLRFCDQSAYGIPYRFGAKVAGTYPLPYGISLSGTIQSLPGGGSTQNGGDASLNENYNISAANFRALTGQALTQASVIVRLLQPGTSYLPRLNYGDLRLSKRFDVGKYRLQAQFDAFNITNANAVTGVNQTYGSSYGRVTDILSARVFAIGGSLSF